MYNPYDQPSNSGGDEPQIIIEYKRNNVFMRKRASMPTINAGGAIVIIIFVVLCLTIFGLLSFATAFADKRLADRTLVSVQEFYAADTLAEQTLAEIFAEVFDQVWETQFAEKPATVVAFQTPVNDFQAICSEVIIYICDNGWLSYRITRWNVILTIDFDHGQQGRDVWEGDFDFFFD